MDGSVLPAERPESGAAANDPLVAAGGRYLVGFDGSLTSTRALRWVTDRARTGTHEIVLMGVAGEQDADPGPLELGRTLAGRAADLRAGNERVVVSTRLARGEVATSLASAAQPGDVLVIGSDKTGYAQGRVYGWRSIQLVASAPVTVVVVPSVDLRMRSGVVVGLRDRSDAVHLVRVAAQEAARQHGTLLLVHAIPAGSSPDGRANGEHLLARARHIAWDEGAGEVTTHLVQRRAADAILNLTRDRALLIVGRSRQRGSLGVGSTLHELLMNANVPSAVVP